MAHTPADVETEKILRRLTVQLDGERASQPELSTHFKKTAMLYSRFSQETAQNVADD